MDSVSDQAVAAVSRSACGPSDLQSFWLDDFIIKSEFSCGTHINILPGHRGLDNYLVPLLVQRARTVRNTD